MDRKVKYNNFYISTLGCAKNTVDSEVLLGKLEKAGLHPVKNPDDAEVIIINTCGFIQDAKQESIDAIMEAVSLKENGQIKKIIVMGCLSERYQEELSQEIPEVDQFLGVEKFDKVLEELEIDPLIGNRSLLTPGHYAYLKIAEGCDNNCSFCAIPDIRGSQRSIKIEDLLEEAQYLAEQGVKELIIIAQDTTRYGTDIYGEPALVELLSELLELDIFPRVRLMYTNPDYWDEELKDLFAKYDSLCSYLDFPVQHASNRILNLMNREKTKEEIQQIIRNLRERNSRIAIRTTVMVGFPGETEEDFKELLDFVKQMKFERLGVFCYSEEEDTEAADFEDNIPEKIKEERRDKIMEVQNEISQEFARGQVGKEITVLIDDQINNEFIGRTEWDAPEVDCKVYIPKQDGIEVGDYITAKITAFQDIDLRAELKSI